VLELKRHKRPVTSIFAPVTELAYVSDSKSEFCEFESRWGHQVMVRWPSGPRQLIANQYNREFKSHPHFQIGSFI
jgi:hypothetical protein